MPVLQFPENGFFLLVPSSGSLLDLGSFTNTTTELKHITLHIYVRGTGVGSERFRLSIYANSQFETAIGSSEWFNLSDFGQPSGGYNYVCFDFDRLSLNANHLYQVAMESENYTETVSFNLNVRLDWPDPVNQLSAAAQMAIIGYV